MARAKKDWEAIHQEYRTGQHSNRVIGSKYGVSEAAIRKKALKEGWKKDLLESYQTEVQTQLIEKDSEPEENQDSANCEPPQSTQCEPKHKTDEEREKDRDVVRGAAKVGADVVREHRRDIKRLKTIASKIGVIVEGILSDDKQIRETAKERFSDLTSHTETVTDVARKLTSIHSECIKLERTAFNLDKAGKEANNADLEDRIKIRMAKKKNAHR